eukprot:tig00001029_g6404.t1
MTRAPKRIDSSGVVRRASLFGPDALRGARSQPAGRPSGSTARGSSGGPRSSGLMPSVARARSPQGAQADRQLGGRPAGLALRAWAPKRIDSSGVVRRASLFGPDALRGARSQPAGRSSASRARGLCRI